MDSPSPSPVLPVPLPVTPVSKLGTLSLSSPNGVNALGSPGGVKRPEHSSVEEPIHQRLMKRRKIMRDEGEAVKSCPEGKENQHRVSILSPIYGSDSDLSETSINCSTPPSKSAIDHLVHDSIASSFLSQPTVERKLGFGKPRRAFSAVPMTSSNANTSKEDVKKITRAQSDSAMTIKHAVENINSNPNLVGDGSKVYILPVILEGKHGDLKEIHSTSLVSLIEGKYSTDVHKFEIIDCRYPYEFEGGHIQGAVNVHTKRQIYERFFGSKTPCGGVNEGKRHIIVFHCEFSSKRAPEMCRYVRDCDRRMNNYPYLHYPELYVLSGGYKAFFSQFKAYCAPQEYLTMVDEKYLKECRVFKSMSKTDDFSTQKKSVTRTDGGEMFRSSTMKKLCLDHLA